MSVRRATQGLLLLIAVSACSGGGGSQTPVIPVDPPGNPPLTAVPAGAPAVQILSDELLIVNQPAQANRWYGRPVMKALDDGTWVMIYANSEAHHLLVESQLHIRFSDDYGDTWTDENRYLDGSVVQGFPLYPPGGEPGLSNEGPGEPWLYVAPNGDLICHFWKVQYALTKNGSYQSRSTDGGRTWSAPAAIDFGGTDRDAFIYSTDDDFVLDGVIYAGAREYEFTSQTDGIRSLLIRSDDNGQSWDVVAPITDYYDYPTNEVGLEYVSDNGTATLVALTRGTDNPGPYPESYKSFSTDMGLTWSTPDADPALQVHGRVRLKTRSHVMGLDDWWLDPVMIAHGFETVEPPNSTPRRIAIYVSKDFGQSWSSELYLSPQGYDGGYGDFLYNPVRDEYVTLQYYAPTSLFDGEIRQINWRLSFE